MAEEAAVTPQIADPGRLPAVADTPDDDAEPRQDHHHDGGDLEEGEPKLQFAEDPHTHQIDGTDDQHHAQHPDPVGHRREPDPHIDTERRHIGDGDDQDLEAVGPAGDVARHRPQVILGIARKGAGLRIVDRHLSQRTHDNKGRDTADQVGQQHAWPRHLDGIGRPIEQAGANRRPQCHKTDMTRIQPPF